MNQRGFAYIILVFIVVLLIGVGAYFVATRQGVLPTLNPAPSPTFTPLPIPSPAPIPNIETIIKKVGEQESSFLIQKINPSSVDGLWYQAYPVPRDEGVPRTLHTGDDIGYACEGVSEKLVGIDYSRQTVTFNKVVGELPPGGCPICL